MIYVSNEQLVIELKKLMLDDKISQKEIADKLEIKPQGLTKLLNKKNFGFEDIKKIKNKWDEKILNNIFIFNFIFHYSLSI